MRYRTLRLAALVAVLVALLGALPRTAPQDGGPLLTVDVGEISIPAGGAQNFALSAGIEHAGKFYYMLGSLSGTQPGTQLGPVLLPLNLDTYTMVTLENPGGLISSSPGFFNPVGEATAAITLPAGMGPELIGIQAHHAYIILDLGLVPVGASNPVALSLVADPPDLAADFSATPTDGTIPLSVAFTDTSVGSPTSWSWDFGDGNTSTGQDPTHVYVNSGTYTVSLTVSDGLDTDSLALSDLITATDRPPTADFSATPTAGFAPLTVQFTDQSQDNPTSFIWDFGDGGASTDQDPAHVYDLPGTYSVSLTVTNSAGSDTLVQTDLITAQAAPPAASFVATPTQGVAPLNVSFADTSSGDIDSWFWDFGDGDTSTTQHPIHLYDLDGLYTVRLTVVGPGGTGTQAKSDLITVDPAGPFADFAATPLTGIEPLTVAFTDLSGGWPDTWQWNFGDGNVSTVQNPTHVYTTPGTFSVTLFATGADGSDTLTKADLITVDEYVPPPFTLEVMSLDTSPLDNRINFAINVINSYGVDTDLSDLTVRYWFTQESYGLPMQFHCDYALLGLEHVTGTFGPASGVMADQFVEIHFEASAGVLLAGAETGQIQVRVNNIDFSSLDENNDYSWTQEVAFTPLETVTVYQNGALVWGIEP